MLIKGMIFSIEKIYGFSIPQEWRMKLR